MAATALLYLLPSLLVTTASPNSAEVRAIWVTRWDFKTAADVRNMVRNCAGLGLNRIYFQVRGRADAFYRSSLEPWGEELGGKDPGFDPLRLALEEARRRRIELHPWVNVLCGWKGTAPPSNRNHIYHVHPQWFLLDRDGKRHRLAARYTMVNPCLPQVRRHIVAVISDIVGRYSVDGLHLDYIRFFGFDPSDRAKVPYDGTTLSLFRTETGGFPGAHPRLWDAFRRRAVDRLVEEIASAVRRLRPRCRLSAAVVSDFERGRKLFFQDAVRWTENGWVERLIPMNYDVDHGVFAFRTSLAMKRAGSQRVHPGLGVHRFRSAQDLRQQISISRKLGCSGFCLFAYASFFPSPSHESRNSKAAWELRASLRNALKAVTRSPPAKPHRPLPSSERRTPLPSEPGKASATATLPARVARNPYAAR